MNAMLDTLVVGLSDAVKQSIEDTIREDERAKVEREIAEYLLDRVLCDASGRIYPDSEVRFEVAQDIRNGDYRKPQEGGE